MVGKCDIELQNVGLLLFLAFKGFKMPLDSCNDATIEILVVIESKTVYSISKKN